MRFICVARCPERETKYCPDILLSRYVVYVELVPNILLLYDCHLWVPAD